MTITIDLLAHAVDLVNRPSPNDVHLRRGISAAYYAVYHLLTVQATLHIAPNVSLDIQHRIGRWFEDAEMKKVCGRFAKAELDQPLRNLVRLSASLELRNVASSFIELQEARHAADYDLGYAFSPEEANDHVRLAIRAINAWNDIRRSPKANIFILSLLMWKNWERERP